MQRNESPRRINSKPNSGTLVIERDDSLSEAEQFARYLERFNMRLYKPTDPDGIRQWLLEFMLLGFMWFEEGIPEDSEQRFPYQLNPRPLDSLPGDRIFSKVRRYSLEELDFICRKLKRPKWANPRNKLRGKVSIEEAVDFRRR